jgi:outer membrane protein OmpA-like peptidoglycan-associated protein
MKRSRLIILAALFCAATAAQAGPRDGRGGGLGMGAGAAAGAVLGGPPGAILGAGLGAFFGERVARAGEAERLEQDLAAARSETDRLNARLASADAAAVARESALAELRQRQALTRELELEVLFRTDSAELEASFATRIQRLARLLRAEPGLGVRLDGHADARGDAGHNDALSAERAAAVRAALVAAGVAPARIAEDHHGARQARAGMDDPEAHALDRRVVIRLAPIRAQQRVAETGAGRH